MEARLVGELVLRQPGFLPQAPNPRAKPLLDGLALHQKQFRGILLKRILLIRRDNVKRFRRCHPRHLHREAESGKSCAQLLVVNVSKPVLRSPVSEG